MAFDKATRNRLASFVSEARDLIAKEFRQQFQSIYGISDKGTITSLDQLRDLDDAGLSTATLLRERIEYLVRTHPDEKDGAKAAVDRLAREQAFTVLNRLAAVRMAEKRDLVVESVGKGYQSKGFKVFEQVAGSALGDIYQRYRRYLFCLFDELAVDLGVLFDRRSPQGLLFPRESALQEMLKLLNATDLDALWVEDETIGWIYQYYNDPAERKKMRDESAAPRNSHELAVRNQFFTPRYVVEFLTDNTLGRIWYEMTQDQSRLKEQCRYLVRRPTEIFLNPGDAAPDTPPQDALSQEELLKQPVYITHRLLKDPRAIRMLDPACGSMHFGLYAFDLYEVIYEEAWNLEEKLGADALIRSSGMKSLHGTYTDKAAFLADVPRLIIEHNIHGIDIDPRCAQIAGLSLWLRAQRAWQQQRLQSQDRPDIRRSNIVCAEPMPGDEALLDEFLIAQLSATPEHKLLGQLVRRVFAAMKLTGEAGSLLKIEEEIASAVAEAKQKWLARPKMEQGRLFADAATPAVQMELALDVTGITDETFWEKAEERIYAALQAYAEQAGNGRGFQHRLFAEDAARGFAFIDLCRKHYDVTLMNPPFGESAAAAKSYIEKCYPNSCQDLFAAFVDRVVSRNVDTGFVGVISTEAGFFRRTLESWRKHILLGQSTMSVMAHFGGHVLDGATVRTASYVLQKPKTVVPSIFLRLLGYDSRNERLLEVIHSVAVGTSHFAMFQTPQTEFKKLPYSVFGYWCSPELRNAFTDLPTTEDMAYVRQGLATSDDLRFLRLRWEVEPKKIGPHGWVPFAKGGEYSPFHYDVHLVLDWNHGSAPYWATENPRTSKPFSNIWMLSETIKNCFGKPGITYPRRTNKRFAPRVMPAGCAFGDKGPAIVGGKADALALVALFNSRPVSYLLGLALGASEAEGGAGANSYEAGLVSRLPIPRNASQNSLLITLAREAWVLRVQTDRDDETTNSFVAYNVNLPNLASILSAAQQFAVTRDAEVQRYIEIQTEIDRLVVDLYKFSATDREEIEQQGGELHKPEFLAGNEALAVDIAKSAVEYALGSAFGRWDLRCATGEKAAPELPDPFAQLPVCPPGQLRNEQGLPITKEDVERLKEEGQWNYPIDIPWDGILVDDPGHTLDIEVRVHQVLQVIWKDRWEAIEHEACEILGVKSLRDYFRKPSSFFADHLKRYSKSRRQAPIYWPLSTASGSYTLSIYYHRLTENTLHTALADFIDPKLRSVRAEISSLRAAGARRDRLEELLDLEKELEDFRAEIERIIKLPWKPNLNDGVLITASPLWKLFRLPKWQKDLKACWEKLANGDYDWAHLAYTIWPKRVEEACKTDRSIAIAHGLEHFCQVEAPKPKAKRGKKTSTPTFEDMET